MNISVLIKFVARSAGLPLLVLIAAVSARAEVSPNEVLVLANSRNTESIILAGHYMEARGIPAENLILLPLPDKETISWRDFSATLWNPLVEMLTRKKWLTGRVVENADKAGRVRLREATNKIGYLVLCRGVPLRVAEESEMGEGNVKTRFPQTGASVDSELATLAMPSAPIIGYVTNPLFGKNATVPNSERQKVVHVSRLDGPTLEDCRRLVNDAVYAEQHGLIGRAYIDIGGPHEEGETWLRSVAALIARTGFDMTLDETAALMDADTRGDVPVLYFGWHSQHVSGLFADASTRFMRGAVAVHIHSFSAATLRSPTQGWAGPLVNRGAAVTLGNVSEPYLPFSTFPHLFFALLLRGVSVGDAYMASTPVLSWQGIVVGDPLYRPFKVSFDAQLRRLESATDGEYKEMRGDYILLRQANLLVSAGRASEAREVLASGLMRNPSAVLSLALARIAKHPSLACPDSDGSKDANIGLLVEIARYLRDNGLLRDSLQAYAQVLARGEGLPKRIRDKLAAESGEVAVSVENQPVKVSKNPDMAQASK